MTLKEYLKISKVFVTSRESSQQRRESSSRESETREEKALLHAKESLIHLESSTRNFTKTVKKATSSMMRVMKKEYLKSRLEKYRRQSASSNPANLQMAMEYVLKTSKSAVKRREKMMRQVFNEVIKRNNFTPEEWKKVKIKVIHKKGDVEDVSNYRPICSLPSMYKLFSTIMFGRLYPMLDLHQAEDQAGFRKTYQTTDHLATYRLICQKCQEWGIKMWTATVDFKKAFDSISHRSIWDALKSCNVNNGYIRLLMKIYRDQKASVMTDEESNIFDIQKGSKQGDPLSSLLFNTVLQYSLKGRNTTMAKKKRNGHLPERSRPRLPDELEVRRRRDAVCNIKTTNSSHDV